MTHRQRKNNSHKGAGTPSLAERGSFLDRRTEGQKTEKQKEKKDRRTEKQKIFEGRGRKRRGKKVFSRVFCKFAISRPIYIN